MDDFIEKLWNIHLEVKKEGYAQVEFGLSNCMIAFAQKRLQDLDLGLFRSDYMVHAEPQEGPPTLGIRQVEFNTISSSFGGLSGLVSKLHATLPRLAGSLPWHPDRASLPHNFSTMGLAAGLVSAWKTYDQAQPPGRPPACVLFVVQDAERNVFDQRHLQHGLTARSIPVFRMPFSSTLRRTEIGADPGRALIYTRPDGARYEVAVLYFRATYAPSEFPDAASWRARLHLERSAAIKCPSILTHIAGCKKVQQVLATPSSTHLERFLPSPADCAAVRATFAAMYPLDDSPAGHRAKALATSPAESQRFVLKPQREGGGNNVYRGAIPPFLAGLGGEARWRGYVLMELIEPPAQRNTILREGRTQTGEVVCELGVFGTCLWRRSSGEVLRNEEAGYLLRTKGRESEEGGVAAGFGAIDSVALVDV